MTVGVVSGSTVGLVHATTVTRLDQWERDDGYDWWTRVGRAAVAAGIAGGIAYASGVVATRVIGVGCVFSAGAGCAVGVAGGVMILMYGDEAGEVVREGVLGE